MIITSNHRSQIMKLFKRPSLACFKYSKLNRPSFACCFKPNKLITFKQLPCKKLLQCFKFRLKTCISIRALRFRRNRPRTTSSTIRRRNRSLGFLSLLFRRPNRPPTTTSTTTRRKNRIRGLLSSVIRRRRRRSALTHHHHQSSEEEGLDEVGELRSMTETGERDRKLFNSPLTPAYVRRNSGVGWSNNKREVVDVEEACRSFENYMVEMMVEEGKMRDLMDVEELLYCWKNLKCPVFIDLVSRFYGELCKDLFLADHGQQEEEQNPNIHDFIN